MSAGWSIGAATTWSDVLRADLPPLFDALKQAAREVGGVQIQNAGTVAGNLCNASPAADGTPVLMALDAEVVLRSASGERRVAATEFVLGNRRTVCAADELVVAIEVPAHSAGARSIFVKLGGRRYLTISMTMVAVVVDRDPGGAIATARIAVGSCSACAQRLPALERKLVGAAHGRRSGWRGRSVRSRAADTDRRPACQRRLPARRDRDLAAPRAAGAGTMTARDAQPMQVVRVQVNDQAPRARRRSVAAARRRAARRPRPHRHEGRLPRRRLRRLHGAARRRAGVRVHRRARLVRGPRRHDGRRPGRGRRHAVAAAAGLRRPRRGAVRRLHAGHADERRGAAAREPAAWRSRGAGRARRRALPLHRLPQDRRGRARGRRRAVRRPSRRPAAGHAVGARARAPRCAGQGARHRALRRRPAAGDHGAAGADDAHHPFAACARDLRARRSRRVPGALARHRGRADRGRRAEQRVRDLRRPARPAGARRRPGALQGRGGRRVGRRCRGGVRRARGRGADPLLAAAGARRHRHCARRRRFGAPAACALPGQRAVPRPRRARRRRRRDRALGQSSPKRASRPRMSSTPTSSPRPAMPRSSTRSMPPASRSSASASGPARRRPTWTATRSRTFSASRPSASTSCRRRSAAASAASSTCRCSRCSRSRR